jgi:hypothetical protein
MKSDDWEAYLSARREQNKTKREREIEKLLAEIAMKHQRAYQEEIAPLMKELTAISMNKPPLPVRLDDGRVFEYVGPPVAAVDAK